MSASAGKFTHKYEMQNVQFVLDILHLLTVSPSGEKMTTFVEKMTSASKYKVFRMLHTLEIKNFVARNSAGDYHLGPAAFSLARGILSDNGRASKLRPVLEELAAATGEAVYLGRMNDEMALLIDAVECRQVVRAIGCLGASFPVTEGRLLEESPICRIYGADETLLDEVSTLSVVFAGQHELRQMTLVLAVPVCRMNEAHITEELLPLLSRCARNLGEMYGWQDSRHLGRQTLKSYTYLSG
ncbi:hypothetical protein [Desulfuromonas sp. AOP6]|uniref:IclR family transcriptional regulator domain-containing protein n=1 Tax=Desulfuromonas sp. AOP6 TaxID=1566351 RepID=UPI00127CB5CE|nr:hypothetical protein [Desulfuromonas sp. AOP6]BCA79969.1 hypothetical protein AOP6_1756 [Desulfuromonas sp. AOP6]